MLVLSYPDSSVLTECVNDASHDPGVIWEDACGCKDWNVLREKWN